LAIPIHSAARQAQIIVATQSVSPIDRFDPNDIIAISRSGHESSFLRLNTTDLVEWLISTSYPNFGRRTSAAGSSNI
jgi:predicted ATPase